MQESSKCHWQRLRDSDQHLILIEGELVEFKTKSTLLEHIEFIFGQ